MDQDRSHVASISTKFGVAASVRTARRSRLAFHRGSIVGVRRCNSLRRRVFGPGHLDTHVVQQDADSSSFAFPLASAQAQWRFHRPTNMEPAMPDAIDAWLRIVLLLLTPLLGSSVSQAAEHPRLASSQYQLGLIAHEPEIVTPIGMAFDREGRLLVVE